MSNKFVTKKEWKEFVNKRKNIRLDGEKAITNKYNIELRSTKKKEEVKPKVVNFEINDNNQLVIEMKKVRIAVETNDRNDIYRNEEFGPFKWVFDSPGPDKQIVIDIHYTSVYRTISEFSEADSIRIGIGANMLDLNTFENEQLTTLVESESNNTIVRGFGGAELLFGLNVYRTDSNGNWTEPFPAFLDDPARNPRMQKIFVSHNKPGFFFRFFDFDTYKDWIFNPTAFNANVDFNIGHSIRHGFKFVEKTANNVARNDSYWSQEIKDILENASTPGETEIDFVFELKKNDGDFFLKPKENASTLNDNIMVRIFFRNYQIVSWQDHRISKNNNRLTVSYSDFRNDIDDNIPHNDASTSFETMFRTANNVIEFLPHGRFFEQLPGFSFSNKKLCHPKNNSQKMDWSVIEDTLRKLQNSSSNTIITLNNTSDVDWKVFDIETHNMVTVVQTDGSGHVTDFFSQDEDFFIE